MKKDSKFHLIYGEHAVLSVLQNQSRTIFSLLVTKDRYSRLAYDITNKYSDIIATVDANYLSKITQDGDKHQGIAIKAGNLKEQIPFIQKINLIKKKEHSCVLLLDKVQDPHNIGAIIRSAACFNVDAIIIPEHGTPIIGSTIVRTSAGCSEAIPIYTFSNFAQALEILKKNDFWLIGLDGSGCEKLSPGEVINKYGKVGIILGNEGAGMREGVKNSCDYLLRIPIASNQDSLNVSNAAAIICYEYFKISKDK